MFLGLTQKKFQAQKNIPNLFPKLRQVRGSEKMSLVKSFEPAGLVYLKVQKIEFMRIINISTSLKHSKL